MFHLYSKEPKRLIISNESLFHLFHDLVKHHPTHLTSPLQIELWKDDWSICDLSQLVQVQLGTHLLCSAFDLIEHENSRTYTHPELSNDAIQYINVNGKRCLVICGLPLYNIKPNKIQIQFPDKTETISIHDHLLGNWDLSYVYRCTKYLIRTTEAPFDDPFIGVTNNIRPSVDYFMDKIHRDHSCLAMISTGHYTKTVYYDTKSIHYADYLEYCLDGQSWSPIDWNGADFNRISYVMLMNRITTIKDDLYIRSDTFAFRFNINKFLIDLEGMVTLTKKANN